MLKKICVFLAIGLVLMTAACGGNTTAADTSGDSASTASGSEENVLILGTLKLEDTDQAITADQASELLVLWKAMRVLSSSDTTSQAELDALFQQIKDTMTADQLSAIEAMNISTDNLSETIQSLGIQIGGLSTENMSEDQRATLEAQLAMGQMPGGDMAGGEPPADMGGSNSGGGMPSGGGGGGGGGGMPSGGGFSGGGGGMPSGGGSGFSGGGEMPSGDMSGMTTGQASSETTATTRVARATTGMNTMLVNALLEKLAEWAGVSNNNVQGGNFGAPQGTPGAEMPAGATPGAGMPSDNGNPPADATPGAQNPPESTPQPESTPTPGA